MAHTHLGHNWYLCNLDSEISDWLLECLSEYIDFVQPYDTMYLRAKRCLNGQREYRVIFSAENDGYRFPVCYLLDLNTGKFKGNKMHYCIDRNGTHYSDRYPVYSDRFKFDHDSKYCREQKQLRVFLNSLDIPDPVPSSKERRTACKKQRRARAHARAHSRSRSADLPSWRVGRQNRKKKKRILMYDITLS
jgi:hypothetical protein